MKLHLVHLQSLTSSCVHQMALAGGWLTGLSSSLPPWVFPPGEKCNLKPDSSLPQFSFPSVHFSPFLWGLRRGCVRKFCGIWNCPGSSSVLWSIHRETHGPREEKIRGTGIWLYLKFKQEAKWDTQRFALWRWDEVAYETPRTLPGTQYIKLSKVRVITSSVTDSLAK